MNVSGVIFFPLEPKKQRSKKKKITPDLRLCERWTGSHHAAILAGTPVDPGTRIPSWFIPQDTHTISVCFIAISLTMYV